MASIVANLPPLTFFSNGSQQHYSSHKTVPKLPLLVTSERKGSYSIVTKATSESSDSSLSIVESVQSVWKSEDRIPLIGLGFAAVVAIWASSNFVTAIDKLPIIPSTFEFIGILYSSWFTYRYLLFRPDREKLLKDINKSISDILGQ